ncbi:hypothetical protein KZZ52_33370 [Dactylosporangium sp. AC04546]|uniref:hypothetical protein n=1 Tax=Dactylosporangium sp. AC04546 TaxID=2862460 RepID=UPI001EE0A27C|nr:hypothetical protein [Dactylosporangium sp. AC04546]WVK78872.1 hypothetical protein KZZ52_33370 [Dactylosporangium sp. AC04546]
MTLPSGTGAAMRGRLLISAVTCVALSVVAAVAGAGMLVATNGDPFDMPRVIAEVGGCLGMLTVTAAVLYTRAAIAGDVVWTAAVIRAYWLRIAGLGMVFAAATASVVAGLYLAAIGDDVVADAVLTIGFAAVPTAAGLLVGAARSQFPRPEAEQARRAA